MKRSASVTARYGIGIVLGLMGYACGSNSTTDDGGTGGGAEGGSSDGAQGGMSDAGPDGTTDGGRDGGMDGAMNGATDGGRDGASDGGEGGNGADSGEGGVATCNPAPADMSPCNANPPCTETCGVNISALTTSHPQRTCSCSGTMASGGRWSCPSSAGTCVYPTDVDLTCFQLPSPLPACPVAIPDGGSADGGSADSGAADGGSSLVQTNSSACTLPNSEVCGGVCGSATVSSYRDSAGVAKAGYCVCIAGIWQCTGVSEWPTLGGG